MPEHKKTFDCVAMKHRIQEEIYEATRGMSEAEYNRFIEDRAQKLRASLTGRGRGDFRDAFSASPLPRSEQAA